MSKVRPSEWKNWAVGEEKKKSRFQAVICRIFGNRDFLTCRLGAGLNAGSKEELWKEVNLTTNYICIHWVFPFVSSFRAPQMLVRTNQHLDSVLMCRWDDPLKVTTFDMTPWLSHCPQLSPTNRGQRQSNPFAPQRDQSPGLLLFILLPKTPPLQIPYTNKNVHQPFSLVGLKAVLLKGQKTSRDIKEFGGMKKKKKKRLIKAWWLLMRQWLNH